jgi:hypothetical protein
MAGVAFATEDANHKQTPITTDLQANANPTNPIPPQPDGPKNPNTSNNHDDNLVEAFGIAYQPDKFSFTTDNLSSTGAQSIPVTK